MVASVVVFERNSVTAILFNNFMGDAMLSDPAVVSRDVRFGTATADEVHAEPVDDLPGVVIMA